MKNCENQTDHAVISCGFEYFLVAQQKSSKIFLQHIISLKRIFAKSNVFESTKIQPSPNDSLPYYPPWN